MELINKHTRFRAYQLSTKGASCSYFNGSYFTLIEARFNDDNRNSIVHELKVCGKSSIDALHITSWDSDHCTSSDLEAILDELSPSRIEYPGYEIDKSVDNQVSCLKLISDYATESAKKQKTVSVYKIDHSFVSNLNQATSWEYRDVIYNNRKDYPEPNNNSTIRLFRSGCFVILSLGDLEKEEISKWLAEDEFIKNEVDILLLAHHGADNGFTTADFLSSVKPKVGIALCNWSNQHGHPDENVLRRLRDGSIDYYSTKQGDLILESTDDHTKKFKVWNYISGGNALNESPKTYHTKKSSKKTIEEMALALKNYGK